MKCNFTKTAFSTQRLFLQKLPQKNGGVLVYVSKPLRAKAIELGDSMALIHLQQSGSIESYLGLE